MHSRKRNEGVIPALLGGIETEQVRVIDLTHPLDEHSPYWPAGRERCPFTSVVTVNFDSRACFARDLTLPEHSGTHLDAPAHALPGGTPVDQLPVTHFLSAACVVDVRRAMRSSADYLVSIADIERHAKRHGPFPRRSCVLFCTGWAARWPSQEHYINEDAKGIKHFPGLSAAAARYLLDRVSPTGIGIDTPSVEGGTATDMTVHRALLEAGSYILENVANLKQLPPRNAAVVALPLRLTGGSGSPSRVLALVPSV